MRYESNRKKFFATKTGLLILMGTFLILLFGVWRQMAFWWQEHQAANALKGELASQLKQKADLNRFIDYYNNPENIEKESRVRLNLKKPGEEVVVLINNESSSSAQAIEARSSGEKPSNFKQWQYYFLHN